MTDFGEIKSQHQRPCSCGRSATGFCTGLHRLTEQEWDQMLLEDFVKPDTKHGNDTSEI